MITTCTDCHARYRLDAERVPHRRIRVRCPSCRGVFLLDGTNRSADPVEPVPVARQETRPAARPAPEPVRPTPVVQRAEPQPAAVRSPASVGTAVLDQPAAPRRRRSKEEMLARALVSDIKVYNRETYERALAAGNLLDALGPEIKKSWELYKEKVTPEVAGSTDYFRDALNEILAEGRTVF
ncbi:MAG: zinc-ribbon domain-containing protein [bacterium]|nr:zinc-ribbon domain-containing protein [bacterium]